MIPIVVIAPKKISMVWCRSREKPIRWCQERPQRRGHLSQSVCCRDISCATVWGYIIPEQGDTDLKEGAILELQQQRKAGKMDRRQQRLAYAKYYKTVKWKVEIRTWNFQIEDISPTKQNPGLRNSLNKCTKWVRYGGMAADEDSCSPWDNNQIERKNTNPDVRTCDGNVPWMNEKHSVGGSEVASWERYS